MKKIHLVVLASALAEDPNEAYEAITNNLFYPIRIMGLNFEIESHEILDVNVDEYDTYEGEVRHDLEIQYKIITPLPVDVIEMVCEDDSLVDEIVEIKSYQE